MFVPIGLGLVALALLMSGLGSKIGEKMADRTVRKRRASDQARTEQERLAQLTPDTQAFARKLIGELMLRGIRPFLGETYRTPEKQREIFEQGTRTAIRDPGWHSFRRAFHLILTDPKTGELDVKARRRDLYAVMHNLVREMGGYTPGYKELRNPVTGSTFTDPLHIEFRGGHTLASLRKRNGLQAA